MLLLLALAFARGVARIALGLLFGFQLRQLGCLVFLFAGKPRGFRRGGFLLAPLLFGLGRVAGFFRLGAGSRNGLALDQLLLHRGIVGPRLGERSSTTQPPRRPLACLQYGLLARALLGFAGSVVVFAAVLRAASWLPRVLVTSRYPSLKLSRRPVGPTTRATVCAVSATRS